MTITDIEIISFEKRKQAREAEVEPKVAKVSDSAIALLERWLTLARSGELSDVVLVGIAGDKVMHGASKTMNLVSRLGAIESAKLEWYHSGVLHESE